MNKNRYDFYKNKYPNVLVIYVDNGKFSSRGLDSKIFRIANLKEVSRLYVDKEDEVRIVNVRNNQYHYYALLVGIVSVVEKCELLLVHQE